MIPLMFLVKDVPISDPGPNNWPRVVDLSHFESRELVRGLTVVVKFLSPDWEIVSRFRDCLPFW